MEREGEVRKTIRKGWLNGLNGRGMKKMDRG